MGAVICHSCPSVVAHPLTIRAAAAISCGGMGGQPDATGSRRFRQVSHRALPRSQMLHQYPFRHSLFFIYIQEKGFCNVRQP